MFTLQKTLNEMVSLDINPIENWHIIKRDIYENVRIKTIEKLKINECKIDKSYRISESPY